MPLRISAEVLHFAALYTLWEASYSITTPVHTASPNLHKSVVDARHPPHSESRLKNVVFWEFDEQFSLTDTQPNQREIATSSSCTTLVFVIDVYVGFLSYRRG